MSETSAFLNYLKAERRVSQHTLKAYQSDLEQFAAHLKTISEGVLLREVQTMHVRSWLASLRESGMSARSIQRKRSSLSTFYRYLRRSGQVSYDPVSKTKAPKTEKRLPTFVESKGMEALFATPFRADGFEGVRDELMLSLFYECGIRLSELIQLRDDSADLSQKTLRVIGKRNKERVLPLMENTASLMASYLDLRHETFGLSSERLLVTDKGQPLYPQFVYRKVNNYLSKVTTLKKRSPHVLRHTFATHMLNNGAQLNSVKELLGHASLAATQVYTHNTIEKLKRVHEQSHPKG